MTDITIKAGDHLGFVLVFGAGWPAGCTFLFTLGAGWLAGCGVVGTPLVPI